MSQLERALVWAFGTWCLWAACALALELVSTLRIDNPLLPPEAIRMMAWVTAEYLAVFTLGFCLAAIRLSEKGRAPRWRWIAGGYAVLLVVLRLLHVV